MTGLAFAGDAVASALTTARDAAVRAGVEVREVSGIEEQAAVIAVLSRIWGRSADNPPVPPELLRAFGKAGNYIAAAYDGDQIVGAAVGFHSTPERHALHSHIAGVAPSHAGRAVGFAMKLHQRAWALERGIDAVEWTFDPLVARNAYFNVAKLHAMPVEYLANFYGAISDAINGDDDTDRLLVRWELLDPAVAAAAAGVREGADAAASGVSVVEVPADIEALRRTDPVRARAWRRDVRERLTALLAAGGSIIGFERGAGYIVRLGGGAA